MTIDDVDKFISCIKNEDEVVLIDLAERLGIEFAGTEDIAYGIFDLMTKSEELILHYKQAMENDADIASIGAYYIKNPSVAKDLFENSDKYIFTNGEIAKLVVATKDSNIIKQVVENREQYCFDLDQLTTLIIASNDKEYIKKFIENREEFGFSAYNMANMVAKVQDNELFKNVIENREYYHLDDFTLLNQVITKIEDKEFLKKYIEESGQYDYRNEDLVALIKATNDVEYIESKVKTIPYSDSFNGNNFAQLIASTHDSTFVKECIQDREKYHLETSGLDEIIISSNDPALMKEMAVVRDELGLLPEQVERIIIATQEPDFMKECVKSNEKYGLNVKNITSIIAATEDTEYINECIDNANVIGLDKKHISILALKAKNQEYIENEIVIDDNNKKIKLPPNMTIGMEIECEGEGSDAIKNFDRAIAPNWRCKGDGSLTNGVEIVSPILHSEGTAEEDINRVCSILNACGQEISDRCGGHIHIGADYLTSVESYKVLSEIWSNSEKTLYEISNEKGTLPRVGTSRYATPISQKIEEATRSGEIDLVTSEDVDEFVQLIQGVQGDRYSGINFLNISENGKNTIEFRLPNGTINKNTWIENINLFGGIVVAAEDISLIKQKSEEELSDPEKTKLSLYQVILDSEVDEKAKLEALLDLACPEEKVQFRERYEENKSLSEQSDVMEQVYSKIAKEPIILTKKEIKQAVLDGENAITGEEYKEGEEVINSQMRDIENLFNLI